MWEMKLQAVSFIYFVIVLCTLLINISIFSEVCVLFLMAIPQSRLSSHGVFDFSLGVKAVVKYWLLQCQ